MGIKSANTYNKNTDPKNKDNNDEKEDDDINDVKTEVELEFFKDFTKMLAQHCVWIYLKTKKPFVETTKLRSNLYNYFIIKPNYLKKNQNKEKQIK